MELVVATRNEGKLKEIRRLLAGTEIVVRNLSEFPELPEIEETGSTFAENAAIKAETVMRLTGRTALADDSGLEVPALAGAPGVRSARYAGEEATDDENNRKLMREMASLEEDSRRGAFACVMALSAPEEKTRLFQGRLEGLLLKEPRGGGGFGYDPLFLVPEYGKTLAELPLEIKNRISHRGQALRKALDSLRADSGRS